MASSAEFMIEGTPFSARGYDAAAGEVVDLQLAASPALDVRTLEYFVAFKSPGAPDPVFSNSGAASPPTAVVTVTMPGSGAHSYIIGARANGGETVLVNGKPDASVNTKYRMIAVRSATAGLRKVVVTETTEYSLTDGWAEAIAEMVDAVEMGGGGGFSTAGDGLTSSGSTVSVGAGTGIVVAADTVSADSATAATANKLVMRDANGRSKVAAPAASDDIATKGYVDSAVGGGAPQEFPYISLGDTDYASQGHVRADDDFAIFARNDANGGDIALLRKLAGDAVGVGGGTSASALNCTGGNALVRLENDSVTAGFGSPINTTALTVTPTMVTCAGDLTVSGGDVVASTFGSYSTASVSVRSSNFVNLGINGSTLVSLGATSMLVSVADIFYFRDVASPVFQHGARTTDAATTDLTIRSQTPFASATGANRNPGNLICDVPAPAAGGTAGQIQCKVSGATILEVGRTVVTVDARLDVGTIDRSGAIGIGETLAGDVTIGNSSGSFTCNTPTAYFDGQLASGTLITGNAAMAAVTLEKVLPGSITHGARTTDAATDTFTITSQAPYASATGSNRNPGNLVCDVPAPAAGGTAGQMLCKVSGTTRFAVTSTGASVTGDLAVSGEMVASRVRQPFVALTYAATTAIDWDLGNNRSVTLTGNVTFTFSNLRDGATYLIKVTQDATGSRTVTWPSTAKFVGTDGTASTAANAVDIFEGVCDGTNIYFNSVKKGFS